MATVYSYVRFSSKRQELGDSVRRQVAKGEAWLKRHPEHTLNTTLRLRDLGVSAFRGKNLDPSKGDLGKFIALAQEGKIEAGSILMLENLDRFSRQPTRKAYRVFCELVEAGVKVLTLDPEQLIDENNIDLMEVVLPIIIKMQLAFEESQKKAGRIVASWETRRRKAREDGTPMSRHCPSWLVWNSKTRTWTEKPGAKKALLYIFRRTCEGIGQKRLTAELQAKFPPFNGRRWNGSMVSDILTSRMVLGEMTPERIKGKTQPIPNYYPRMIPDDLFYRARAASVARRSAKGQSRHFVNLFVGLMKMTDGHPAHIQTAIRVSGTGRHLERRIVSAGHREGVAGACSLSVDYGKVERYIMAVLYELKPGDLFPLKGKRGEGIRERERELAGVEHRLADLEKALGNSNQPVPQLLAAISELQSRRDGIKGQIENLRQREATATANPVEQAQDIVATLANKPLPEQHDLRLKLRGLIADIVEGVEIEPYRTDGRRVEARVKVHWRDNPLGWILIDTGKVSVDTTAEVSRDLLPRMERQERQEQATPTKPAIVNLSKRQPARTRTTAKRPKRAS